MGSQTRYVRGVQMKLEEMEGPSGLEHAES